MKSPQQDDSLTHEHTRILFGDYYTRRLRSGWKKETFFAHIDLDYHNEVHNTFFNNYRDLARAKRRVTSPAGVPTDFNDKLRRNMEQFYVNTNRDQQDISSSVMKALQYLFPRSFPEDIFVVKLLDHHSIDDAAAFSMSRSGVFVCVRPATTGETIEYIRRRSNGGMMEVRNRSLVVFIRFVVAILPVKPNSPTIQFEYYYARPEPGQYRRIQGRVALRNDLADMLAVENERYQQSRMTWGYDHVKIRMEELREGIIHAFDPNLAMFAAAVAYEWIGHAISVPISGSGEGREEARQRQMQDHLKLAGNVGPFFLESMHNYCGHNASAILAMLDNGKRIIEIDDPRRNLSSRKSEPGFRDSGMQPQPEDPR